MNELSSRTSIDVQVFRRSQAERATCAFAGVLLIASGPFSFLVPKLVSSASQEGVPNGVLPFLSLLMLTTFVAGIYLLYRSGPQEILIDKKNQTYQIISGWPFFPQIKAGTWKDIWGIYLGASQNGGYIVGIAWWGENNYMTLERFYQRSTAERLVEELISAMGVRKVIPPRYLRPYR